MKIQNSIALILAISIMLSGLACKKYLEVSTDKKLVVISRLQDIQGLLDDYYKINYRDPGVGEESTDNYFLTHNVWESQDEYSRNRYTWNADQVIPPYVQNGGNEWSEAYDKVYTANTVLDNIKSVKEVELLTQQYEDVKGQAYFLRGKTFLQLAWIWCLAYDSLSAEVDMGIPLRLTSDFNIPSERSNLKLTYKQIIDDLKTAAALLPLTAVHVMRPSRAAAYGYLARAYLSVRDYKNAGLYADSCLQLRHELLDFNTIIPSIPFPIGIGRFNQEVIHESKISISDILYSGRIKDELYQMYDDNDLRKNIFFRQSASTGLTIFMGSYEQDYDLFSGIATDEMFLVRAECYVRQGLIEKAMDDINRLMEKRWRSGTFTPIHISNNAEALTIVLRERRKELLMRGLRWIDIKRFNKEGQNIVLKRELDTGISILEPNDLRYALAIPEDVTYISGIAQNPR